MLYLEKKLLFKTWPNCSWFYISGQWLSSYDWGNKTMNKTQETCKALSLSYYNCHIPLTSMGFITQLISPFFHCPQRLSCSDLLCSSLNFAMNHHNYSLAFNLKYVSPLLFSYTLKKLLPLVLSFIVLIKLFLSIRWSLPTGWYQQFKRML